MAEKATIIRKKLLQAALGQRHVTAIEAREITFRPSQETGRHLHPCPVVGYIADGTALLQIDGQEPQLLPAGSAVYEPAGTVIQRFKNASPDQPLKFIAFYILDGKQDLITMLE